jgi:UDP-2,3-diacylglucosamine pyrophosphatase LpxH
MDMAKSGIKVREDHLCVISDLHLGNPIFLKNRSLRHFFRHMAGNGASLCINGDGMDLLQFSVPKLAKDTLSAFKSLKDFFHNSQSEIYYILGNHDIFMKSHLEEAGVFPVVSTLEVASGDKLIHIEHGHFYDYLFQNYQKLYFRLARLLGKALRICPEFFHLYFKVARVIDRLAHDVKNKQLPRLALAPGDSPRYLDTARNILATGFDIVIFGHSHRHGLHVLEDGKIYANAGTWTSRRSHFLEIQKGAISLKEWR